MNSRFLNCFVALGAVFVFGGMSQQVGARSYKWTDENGRVHYSQTKPPEQIDQKFEEISTRKSTGRGDPECCMALRKVADKMIKAQNNGATLDYLYSFYHPELGKLKQLANFVANKYQSGIRPSQISHMSLDACLNGAFTYCSAKFAGNRARGKSSGSGFFVDHDGHLLTNAHVVKNCSALNVLPGGLAANVISADLKRDLALIKVDKRSDYAAVFRQGEAQLGEEIVVAGFPYRGELSSGIHITPGNVSSMAGAKNDQKVIQITAAVQPGNSGGPLLDRSGNVAGVVVSKLNSLYFAKKYKDIPQGISFAVRSQLVRDFLNEQKIDYRIANLEARKETTEISEVAKAIAVIIECKA